MKMSCEFVQTLIDLVKMLIDVMPHFFDRECKLVHICHLNFRADLDGLENLD